MRYISNIAMKPIKAYKKLLWKYFLMTTICFCVEEYMSNSLEYDYLRNPFLWVVAIDKRSAAFIFALPGDGVVKYMFEKNVSAIC